MISIIAAVTLKIHSTAMAMAMAMACIQQHFLYGLPNSDEHNVAKDRLQFTYQTHNIILYMGIPELFLRKRLIENNGDILSTVSMSKP